MLTLDALNQRYGRVTVNVLENMSRSAQLDGCPSAPFAYGKNVIMDTNEQI